MEATKHIEYMAPLLAVADRSHSLIRCSKCPERDQLRRLPRASEQDRRTRHSAAEDAYDLGGRWAGDALCSECSVLVRKHEMEGSNKAAPVNALIAPWFQFGHDSRRVTEQQRSSTQTDKESPHMKATVYGYASGEVNVVALRPRPDDGSLR
jgi:hypothetical protein